MLTRRMKRVARRSSIAFLLALPAAALASDQVPMRVRYLEGGATVQRAAAGTAEQAIVNLPLDVGDRFWTDSEARAELLFAGGTFIWVNGGTTLDVVALADSGGEGAILRVWTGSLILHRGATGSVSSALRVDTPNGSALFSAAGRYRLDVDAEQRVWLAVFEGVAELVAGGLAEPVRSGQRSYAEAGTAPATATAFNTAEMDDFSNWQMARLEENGRSERYVSRREYVPRAMIHQVAELEPYGNWAYRNDFNAWAWRPTVGLDWSPYRHGRWAYTYGGWSWVPYHSWGWVTSHYGRWHHSGAYGWLWFPGARYSPAWVSWYVGGGYVGWTPLGFYNRPFVSINAFFGNHHGGGYAGYGNGNALHSGRVIKGRGYTRALDRAWTFVASDKLGSDTIARHAVAREQLRDVAQVQSHSVLQGPLRLKNPANALRSLAVSRNPTLTPKGTAIRRSGVSGTSAAVTTARDRALVGTTKLATPSPRSATSSQPTRLAVPRAGSPPAVAVRAPRATGMPAAPSSITSSGKSSTTRPMSATGTLPRPSSASIRRAIPSLLTRRPAAGAPLRPTARSSPPTGLKGVLSRPRLSPESSGATPRSRPPTVFSPRSRPPAPSRLGTAGSSSALSRSSSRLRWTPSSSARPSITRHRLGTGSYRSSPSPSRSSMFRAPSRSNGFSRSPSISSRGSRTARPRSSSP